MNMNEEDRQRLLGVALSDRTASAYRGMVKILEDCEAQERRARQNQPYVVLPFFVEDVDIIALERQFSVAITIRGTVGRVATTPRAAALMFLVESALSEYASGCNRSTLAIDGDIMTAAALGIEGRIIERTHATSRLATGYYMEDEALRRFVSTRSGNLNVVADILAREQTMGGGEHYWPHVREISPRVDSIIVNHFKTPVGPKQLAWLAFKRGAVVYGAIPFQFDMLTSTSGDLNCFPGRFYIDEAADVITLVPKSDATMSISHPYAAWKQIVLSNSITAGGREFLCEKYKSVPGVMYYTLSPVEHKFEAPETLRTHYFNPADLGVTVIKFPKVKLSEQGVPVGWERGQARIMTSRLEKVLSRLMTSANDIVYPTEAFTALVDYNNSVPVSLDVVMTPDRIAVSDEQDLALALALHVNWTRHAAKGTFNTLLNAVKARYAVKDAMLYKFAFIALSAWWTKPRVDPVGEEGSLPVTSVVDWCGRDFSVVMADADPWIEVATEVGCRNESDGIYYPWLPIPKPVRDDKWLAAIVQKARDAVGDVAKVAGSSAYKVGCGYDTVRGVVANRFCAPAEPTLSKPTVTVVDEFEALAVRQSYELTDLKKKLVKKMVADQGAVNEAVVDRYIVTRGGLSPAKSVIVPVVDVEPISAIRSDILMCNGGPFDREAVSTGYRIAESDIDKVTEGSLVVNDAKRLIPVQRWVRMPKVDAGVEGKRVSSQHALIGALMKRNVGIPSNRGHVDLELVPAMAVEKIIQVCYRDDWESVLERHLNAGMWEANMPDIEDFVGNLDEKKVKGLLNEFFLEGYVSLDRWLLMAKGKIKSSREPGADGKVDHSQTIMYLENSSTNAMYSAMTRRFKDCIDECLRPEVLLNPQLSDDKHEEWYNSLNTHRASFQSTYSYSADIRCYDRSQEHVALKIDLEFYRRHGLSEERLKLWEQTHGVKRAHAMMFGIVLTMVLGGISGLWKTLMRNGIVNLASFCVSTEVTRDNIVMIDIKGDDMDVEVGRPIVVENAVERMSLTFNLSAKFHTNDVRYMCKQFRIRVDGVWYFVADPWARVQSLCTPLWVGNHEDNLKERWNSLRADLRHYDNGTLVDAVAEAAQVFYGVEKPVYGMARGLSAIAFDFGKYVNFFDAPKQVG